MTRAIIGFVLFIVFMHWLSYLLLTHTGMAVHAATDPQTLLAVTMSLLLSWMLMLSQAMESITRGFYTRGDLDLILASPVDSKRVFGLRVAVNAVLVSFMSLLLLGPAVNVLVVIDNPRWLAGYVVALVMGLTATALAVLTTVALFHLAGPKRTRFIAQVLAAIMGAAFAIGIQMAAIVNSGSLTRSDILHSPRVLAYAPGPGHWLWLPARAIMGDGAALGILLAVAAILYIAVTWPLVGRFAHYATAAAGVSQTAVQQHSRKQFASMRPIQAMRQKEWRLLWRDPWLVSQTLMQLLYLLPPALMLWQNFSGNGRGILIAVPVLVMAAGQLAGGVTWITISAEDAPDLVATCPLSPMQIMLAKLQTVMRAVAMVFAPLLLLLACQSPWVALVSAGGIMIASASSLMIQLWFRTQSKRSAFRRRHTASRIATFAEAFCCIAWAATAALVAIKTWMAIVTLVFALLVLIVTRSLRPKIMVGQCLQ